MPLAQDEDEMPVVDSSEGEQPDDLEKFCADMERLGRSFGDTLAGLYSDVYDSELKAVAAKENQMQTLQAMEDATCPTLSAQVREIMRTASTTTQLVTGIGGAGPMPGVGG